ncbi:hypothetical protein [Micromonospora sp. ATCC 39149]|uniref:hypothetical protein n=1 Tax=Micromonospora sp. (strain ATCC 39149 / NRRL 15099 / SCC 1413) TaxID=219305 RepID=UPI0002D5D577|nr:hypothetical protein [Micromonospora sp. ATCC 39149]
MNTGHEPGRLGQWPPQRPAGAPAASGTTAASTGVVSTDGAADGELWDAALGVGEALGRGDAERLGAVDRTLPDVPPPYILTVPRWT